MKNYLLKIAYDGSGFHGWQEQSGLRTVQGEIEKVLSLACNQDISVSGTSRTDAGVHALMQCCSFQADTGIPTENIPKVLNNMLSGGRYGEGSKGADLQILSAQEMPNDFHARFNCSGKTYKYLMSTKSQNVFRKNYCYTVDSGALDIAAMNKAAKLFMGTHDFAAFQAAGGTPRKTTVRTISGANVYSVSEADGESKRALGMPACEGDIIFSVTGDGFLYNMVRIMTGTLVEVGLGKINPDDISKILESADRTRAGHTAPPCGLYLAEVYFD